MLSALSFGFIFHQLVHASKEFAPLFRGLVSHSICSLSSLSTAMDTLRSQSRRTYHEASSIDLTEHQHDLSQIKESQQLSEMFNIVDCQVQTAQNLKNQLVRSIMEKHLYAKEYPEKLEERIPLKELLTLVNKHLDDIVQKKHDTEKTVAKVMKEHHESTAELEQWIQQLNAEKAELQQAVDRIIEKDILFQKGFCPKRKNVCAADMATALKRHQDMEEHYRRMKNEIQGYSKTLLESTERIVKQLGQDISQNEARMQELLQKHIAETKKISQREAERDPEHNHLNTRGSDNQAQNRLGSDGQHVLQILKQSIEEYMKLEKEQSTERLRWVNTVAIDIQGGPNEKVVKENS